LAARSHSLGWIVGIALVALGCILLWPLFSKTSAAAVEPEAPGKQAGADVAVESSVTDRADDAPEARVAEGRDESNTVGGSEVATIVTVRAVELQSGSPVAGARVNIFRTGEDDWSEPIDGHVGTTGQAPTTDAVGEVTFHVDPADAYTIFADGRPVGYNHVTLHFGAVLAGEERIVVVELERGEVRRVTVRVVDHETREEIVGAEARYLGTDVTWVRNAFGDEWSHAAPADQTTDGAGLFTLEFPSWERTWTQIDAPGYDPVLFDLTEDFVPGETAHVALLSKQARLLVTLDGERTDGVQVVVKVDSLVDTGPMGRLHFSADLAWARATGADGMCTISGLPPHRSMRVELYRDGEWIQESPEALRLLAGEERAVTYYLGAGTDIEFVLEDLDGVPVAHHDVTLTPAKGGGEFTYFALTRTLPTQGVTDENGRCVFEGVQPGEWWIGPDSTRQLLLRISSIYSPPRLFCATLGVRVRIAPGERQRSVRATCHAELGLHGIVLDPAGERAPDVHLVAVHEGARLYTNSNDDGVFHFGPLVPGAYDIGLAGIGPGFSDAEPLRAQAGDEELVVRLVAGADLRVRVVDAVSGETLQAELLVAGSAEDDVRVVYGNLHEGAYEVNGLKAETYSIVARTGDGRVGLQSGVVVTPGGETQEVVVAVELGARLSVAYRGDEPWVWVHVRSGGTVVGYDNLQSGSTLVLDAVAGEVELRISKRDGTRLHTSNVELSTDRTTSVVHPPEEDQ